MELGISSFGHFVDFALSKKFDREIDLLLKATEAGLIFAEENKIKICEVFFDPPDIFIDENKKKFIDLCNSFSVKKQIHAPLIDVCLCSVNQFISNATVELFVEIAKICNQIDAEIFNICPGSSFLGEFESIKTFNKKRLVDSVNKLLDATAGLNVNICMEHMPNAFGVKMLLYLEEIEQFFYDLNRKDIFLTWDTSHSWTCDINLEVFWKKFHNIIKNIHIAENFNKKRDTHPAIGSGKINFQEIFDLIKKYDYNGALIIEIASAKDLSKSLDYVKKFL